jgi:hypothetical protein
MQSALFDRRRRGAVVARLLPFNSIIEGQNAEPWPGKRVTASPHPDQGRSPPYQTEVAAVVTAVCFARVLWSLGQTGAGPPHDPAP